ncbi:MAG TPA: hypothetical protein VGC99_03455 [Candidatus Tectomicrobia bacterium]
MNIGGVNVIVLIFVVSFGIDRIVTGILFLLSYVGPWSQAFPEPVTIRDTLARTKAEKKQKLAYFVFAGVLSLGVIATFGKVRIFDALGYTPANDILDIIVTGIILTAGSDCIAKLLDMSGFGGVETSPPRPIEVTGRLILEQGTGMKIGE